MRKLKLKDTAVPWLLSDRVRNEIQNPTPIFFAWGIDLIEKRVSAQDNEKILPQGPWNAGEWFWHKTDRRRKIVN